ncbi:MAG: hypothetical protein JWP63_2044 [Candidatus Solibacter sp.]|nr:hypothetical protein [Candidatus Solibacter sp.]
MIRRGMTELTGAPNQATAWNQLFQKGDVVGIKVNPNAIPSPISSPAVINEILQGLLGAGVTRNDIVVCDRNSVQLKTIAGWLPSWVRLDAASWEWSTDQTEVGGYNPNKMSGVSGYNPSYSVDCPKYLLPWQDAANPKYTRSYVAQFVTRVTKIISLSVLKDHQTAGVTLGLKNLCQECITTVRLKVEQNQLVAGVE